jgi:hypothetical protein
MYLQIASILVPSLITLIVPFLTYLWLARRMARYQTQLSKDIEHYKIDLSKELEHYKADISKELESHKLQLQAAFQTKLYEFQTRYSWLHQKRAEAIVKLYELLARVHTDLQRWSAPGDHAITKPANEFFKDAQAHITEMTAFFDEKRILFHGEEIASRVIEMITKTTALYSSHPDIEYAKEFDRKTANFLKEHSYEMTRQYINPLMARLRGELLKLLEAETPSHNPSQSIEQQAARSTTRPG